MTVNRGDIERIARLAALAVDAEALPELTRQIGRILEYVAQLDALDTTGVQPDGHPPTGGPAQPLRPDEPGRTSLSRPPAEFAPAFTDGLFLVPRLGAVGDDPGTEAGA